VAHEWTGFTPPSAHPQSVNQDYYISWNNKQANDYSAADGNFSFGAVHRGQMLDLGVRNATAGGTKLDRAAAVKIMADAATTDLRAQQNLGLILQVINSQPVSDPNQAALVNSLQTWLNNGAHRIETSPGSHTYRDAAAIRAFDTWWPQLVAGEFQPSLGNSLYGSLVGAMQVDEPPSDRGQPHKGSSFQFGWWGYVNKDLRSVLGQPVTSPLAQTYCGNEKITGYSAVLFEAFFSFGTGFTSTFTFVDCDPKKFESSWMFRKVTVVCAFLSMKAIV